MPQRAATRNQQWAPPRKPTRKMTEAEIIRARIRELQRMLAALQASLRTPERDKAISAFHRAPIKRTITQ
jgi:hypothetical protein